MPCGRTGHPRLLQPLLTFRSSQDRSAAQTVILPVIQAAVSNAWPSVVSEGGSKRVIACIAHIDDTVIGFNQ